MEVILKEDINKLGHRGDVVKVAEGYGRNYLIPKKLAIEATPGSATNSTAWRWSSPANRASTTSCSAR